MDLDSAYKILELEDSVDIKEVRTTYRDLAEIWHPDKYAHKPRLAEKAAGKMKEINCAYAVVQVHCKNKGSSFKAKPANEPEEELFDFIDCINCGAINRVPKNISDLTPKCGKCGLNLNIEAEKSYDNRTFCDIDSCEGRILSNGRCSVCGRTIPEGVQAEKATRQTRRATGQGRRAAESEIRKLLFLSKALVIGVIAYIVYEIGLYMVYNL